MKPNKWKIFGQVVITWLIFSFLAKGILIAMQESNLNLSMIDTQSTVWSWMSLFMGIFMGIKFRKWSEFGLGVIFFLVCLIPLIGFLAGIYYFAWCYYKLEQKRITQ